MDAESIRSWTVAQILENSPQTAKGFIAWKTNCVGCCLSRFCTLEEVAAIYSLDLAAFLVQIQNLIQTPKERIVI
jgi:hypothetical protein